MSAERRSLWKDESGATLIEFTAVVFTFFGLLFGVIEFSYAYYQWNGATKAVQQGARIAAVSSPIETDMTSIDGLKDTGDPDTQLLPGDPIPAGAYRVVCEYSGAGAAMTLGCTCASSAGTSYCPDTSTPALNNLYTIVCGYNLCQPDPDDVAADGPDPLCPNPVDAGGNMDPRRLGMCHFLPRIKPKHVRVTYEYTGLGYAGRPGGPVPTVTVELKNLQFEFILMAAFVGTNSITMPSFATTMTGEDLNVAWSDG